MMIFIKLLVMLLKITPNEIILEETFKISLPIIIQRKYHTENSLFKSEKKTFHQPQTLQFLSL